MKKTLWGPMFIYIFIGLGIAIFSFISDFDDIKIHLYDADITINDQGDMHVIETFEMTYKGDYNVRFRDIVYDKYPKGYPFTEGEMNIASFNEDIASIKVFKDGLDITDHTDLGYSFLGDYDELGERIVCPTGPFYCESLFANLMPVGGLYGDITFVYEYEILGAVTSYSDISELNWRLFEYMESDIEKVHINISLPHNVHPISSFQFYTHGGIFNQGKVMGNQIFLIEAENVKSDQFVEFRLLMPNDLFPHLDEKHQVIADDLNLLSLQAYEEDLMNHFQMGEKLIQIPKYGSFVVIFLMVGATLGMYFLYDKEHQIDFKPSFDLDLPSEDTPAEVGYLYRMQKVTDQDITATLLDLIRKNVIGLDFYEEEINSSDASFTLTWKKDHEHDLKAHEKHLLFWFFDVIGKDGMVKTKDIEAYAKKNYEHAKAFEGYAKTFMQRVKQEVNKSKYFDTYSRKQKGYMRLPVIIPLVYGLTSIIIGEVYGYRYLIYLVLSLGLTLGYLMYVSNIKRRSRTGQGIYKKWDTFKENMLDMEKLKTSSIPSILEWEHYLVYATTFNIADKVMEQFKVIMPTDDREESITQYQRSYILRGYTYHRISYAFYDARKSAGTVISKHHSSSGGRGGSSFGGGGGGGRSR